MRPASAQKPIQNLPERTECKRPANPCPLSFRGGWGGETSAKCRKSAAYAGVPLARRHDARLRVWPRWRLGRLLIIPVHDLCPKLNRAGHVRGLLWLEDLKLVPEVVCQIIPVTDDICLPHGKHRVTAEMRSCRDVAMPIDRNQGRCVTHPVTDLLEGFLWSRRLQPPTP